MHVRVQIFGSGPRARRVCAALVTDALAGALVHCYEERRVAEAAVESSSIPVILLDARVAVEPEAFRRFALEGGNAAALARSFDGSVASSEAARRYADGAALAASGASTLPRHESIGAWLEEPEPSASGTHALGVDVHSYGWGPTGLATASRNLMVGLQRAGVDVNWLPWFPEPDTAALATNDGDVLRQVAGERARHDRALVYHAPTYTSGQDFLETYTRAYARGPVACATTFETDTIPARWAEPLRACSRVWVPSSFNVESFVAGGVPREQIDLVPISLDIEHQPLDGATLTLPEARSTIFVSVFEWTLRKGWDALVTAWAQAFTRDDDVCLVIRAAYPETDIAATIKQFLGTAFRLDRIAPIIVITEKLTQAQLVALYRSATAYVLPSRGEGFGLPYLEAMAVGVPAIGTAWSGMSDFLDRRTGYPVEAGLVTITSPLITRMIPVFKDQRWAEPSVPSLMAAFRSVFERRDEAALIGARGAVVARTQFNRTRIGRLAAEALARIEPRKPSLRRNGGTHRLTLRADLYLTDGLGAEARALLAALERTGFECATDDEGPTGSIAAIHHHDAANIRAAVERAPEPASPLIVAGEPARFQAAQASGPRIARVVATEATLQPTVLAALASFDELWVPSGFSRDRFTAAGLEPRRIVVLPSAIDQRRWVPQIGGQDVAPLQARTRMVLYTDWSPRSGWDLALGAFLQAFEPDDGASLTLKILGADPERPVNYQGDVVAAAQRLAPHRLSLLGRYPLSISTGVAAEVDAIAFTGSFDTFLACGREIGWGRPVLEAMACALTIVAPRAGNHRAFIGEDDAFLVDAAPTAKPTWFEPNLEALARTLRRIHDDRDEAYARGRRARRSLVANHSLEVAGEAMRRRLEGYVEAEPGIERAAVPLPATRLSVVVDARFEPERLERALAWLRRMTANEPAVTVMRGSEPFAPRLARAAEDADFVAYLRSDVVVGPAWDDFLIEALRLRPRIAFVVPRTFDVPGPQGGLQAGTMFDARHLDLDADSGFAAFSRSISLVHAARGSTLDLFSTCCVMFDARRLAAAFAREAELDSPEALARACLADGTFAWLAHDAVVQNGSSGAASMVAA